jgi:hypothetical protein
MTFFIEVKVRVTFFIEVKVREVMDRRLTGKTYKKKLDVHPSPFHQPHPHCPRWREGSIGDLVVRHGWG